MIQIKRFLYLLLCNSLTGLIISRICGNSIPNIRWGGFRFAIRKESVNKKILASIFWGFYESSEIRFIEKYLEPSLDVLEFGGSIGVVSSHIIAKLNTGHKLIIVEANPFLISLIETNVNRNRVNGVEFKILNLAVNYTASKVSLCVTNNNTETRVNFNSLSSDEVLVEAQTLSSIIREANYQDYALVCDIEGSEIEIFLNEKESLKLCKQLFIELHDTFYDGTYYTPSTLINLITQKGFELKDRRGPVCYFQQH